jgi:hypothetical protein
MNSALIQKANEAAQAHEKACAALYRVQCDTKRAPGAYEAALKLENETGWARARAMRLAYHSNGLGGNHEARQLGFTAL